MSDFPSQQQDKFVLRLPDGMRDRIKAAADVAGRSMNSEIVSVLEKAYPEITLEIEQTINQIQGLTLRISKCDDPEEVKRLMGEMDKRYAILSDYAARADK